MPEPEAKQSGEAPKRFDYADVREWVDGTSGDTRRKRGVITDVPKRAGDPYHLVDSNEQPFRGHSASHDDVVVIPEDKLTSGQRGLRDRIKGKMDVDTKRSSVSSVGVLGG